MVSWLHECFVTSLVGFGFGDHLDWGIIICLDLRVGHVGSAIAVCDDLYS
jgi:hypothetical protein